MLLLLDFGSFKPKMMVQSREIFPGLIVRQGTGTKKGTVPFSNPWTIWACLNSVAGATVKARYTAPTCEDCIASTIWVAFSTSWPSIIMNYNAGLDRCHLTRSLIFALLDHENLYYYSLNASASGKAILRSKNSFTTTLSTPELLISTNIPPPPLKRANVPRTIHLTHPIPSLRNTTHSVHWTKRAREYSRSSYKQS